MHQARRRPPKQLELGLQARPTWGGRRKGAGRKPTRPGTWIEHVARPAHDQRHPAHVTLRVRRDVGHLRRWKVARAIGRAMRAAADPARRDALAGFRVVEFSIQHDHLHLIVEAMSRKAMARGMKGLACRIAKAVNRALERSGAVFADRYHVRALATPTEVRHALRYVLQNAAKHEAQHPAPDVETCTVNGIDPCSSARWFTGWRAPPPPPDSAPPCSPPRTWLLREGWRRLGLLARQ